MGHNKVKWNISIEQGIKIEKSFKTTPDYLEPTYRAQ